MSIKDKNEQLSIALRKNLKKRKLFQKKIIFRGQSPWKNDGLVPQPLQEFGTDLFNFTPTTS